MAADRHLLFGLLALQNGLIQPAQLVAAFHAWTLDKSRPLGDHLETLGYLNAAQRSAIEALAALHVEAHGGSAQRSLAALDVGGSTLDRLQEIGDPVVTESLAGIGRHSLEPDSDRTATLSLGTATADGQRFRVLRPYARGGLGAVFVALDSELNREVALKEILDDRADDPVSRQRFLLEAEITGGLEHPGIVPVYGLGTYNGGRPFYAMRFVRGDSLKIAITRFHSDPELKADPGRRSLELRKLLRRFLDVCNAIEYAHSRGVLHRDIKPGNVIVGKHGETLVVDWGLAKAVGRPDAATSSEERMLVPSTASGSVETLAGSALGTPGYMSPEQARGDLIALGPRSDVYSLGATLYSLLTGKPPFEKGNVGAVLRAVEKGEFSPPRALDATIDRALEAVCLKAMATRPEDRYATPRALADDIERWMADEPVSSWREPMARRTRRWARRNRTPVTSAAVAVVAGVIGLSAVLAIQIKAKADIDEALTRETHANTALAATNAELIHSKAAVQDRYNLAVDAIKTFYTGVSGDFLLKQDRFKELRDRLLKSAADFYGKLGALLGKETDFASRRALAQANFEVAFLTGAIGRKEDALAAHRAVLTRREALAADPAANPETKADVGHSLTAIADVLSVIGKMDEAEATSRKALAIRQRLADDNPTDIRFLDQVASSHFQLGWVLSQTAKAPMAEAEYRRGMTIQQERAAKDSSDSDTSLSSLAAHNWLALHLSRTGKPEEAMAEYRKALAIGPKLTDVSRDVGAIDYQLGLSHNDLALLLRDHGEPVEAEAEFREAISARQRLVEGNPSDTHCRSSLAYSHNHLAWMLLRTDKLPGAEAEFREAMVIRQRLVDENPGVPTYRNELSSSLLGLSDILRKAGKRDNAREMFARGLRLREELFREDPQSDPYKIALAATCVRAGAACVDDGDLAGASQAWRRAAQLFDGVKVLNGEWTFLRGACHAGLSGIAGRPGSGVSAAEVAAQTERAMAFLRQAISMGYNNLDVARTEQSLDPLRGRDDFRLLLMDMAMPADPFTAIR